MTDFDDRFGMLRVDDRSGIESAFDNRGEETSHWATITSTHVHLVFEGFDWDLNDDMTWELDLPLNPGFSRDISPLTLARGEVETVWTHRLPADSLTHILISQDDRRCTWITNADGGFSLMRFTLPVPFTIANTDMVFKTFDAELMAIHTSLPRPPMQKGEPSQRDAFGLFRGARFNVEWTRFPDD